MRLLTATVVLFVAIAHAQDDDLSSAFGPQKAKKAFEPEHNVPPAFLPTDPNAELRVTFEQQLSAAQTTFDQGDAASARDQLAMAELNKALATPALKDHLRAQGADAAGGSAAEFGAMIRNDYAKWAKVVKDSGAKVD